MNVFFKGWCHVVCALFVPEAWFGNVQTMEPIILKGVPQERYNKVIRWNCMISSNLISCSDDLLLSK